MFKPEGSGFLFIRSSQSGFQSKVHFPHGMEVRLADGALTPDGGLPRRRIRVPMLGKQALPPASEHSEPLLF
jgi:hypothetical protein